MSKMGALRSGICFSPPCQVDTALPSAAKNDRAGDVDENPRLFFDLRGDLASSELSRRRPCLVRVWEMPLRPAFSVSAGEMPRPRTTDDWDVRRGSVA
jgi:hypothetical protein